MGKKLKWPRRKLSQRQAWVWLSQVEWKVDRAFKIVHSSNLESDETGLCGVLVQLYIKDVITSQLYHEMERKIRSQSRIEGTAYRFAMSSDRTATRARQKFCRQQAALLEVKRSKLKWGIHCTICGLIKREKKHGAPKRCMQGGKTRWVRYRPSNYEVVIGDRLRRKACSP